MNEGIMISQRANRGSEGTQIGHQENHYYGEGLSSEQAAQLAIDLFWNNFPRLQNEAMCQVNSRIEELVHETVRKMLKGGNVDFSGFSEPDAQYMLYEAEKGYARRNSKELLGILSELISTRMSEKSVSHFCIVLDKAIEMVTLLQQEHLDYLSLVFIYKHVFFRDLKCVEDVFSTYEGATAGLSTPTDRNYCLAFVNSLGLTMINLDAPHKRVAKIHGFNPNDVKGNLPHNSEAVHSDYGLTPVGLVIAILNANARTNTYFSLSEWIY